MSGFLKLVLTRTETIQGIDILFIIHLINRREKLMPGAVHHKNTPPIHHRTPTSQPNKLSRFLKALRKVSNDICTRFVDLFCGCFSKPKPGQDNTNPKLRTENTKSKTAQDDSQANCLSTSAKSTEEIIKSTENHTDKHPVDLKKKHESKNNFTNTFNRLQEDQEKVIEEDVTAENLDESELSDDSSSDDSDQSQSGTESTTSKTTQGDSQPLKNPGNFNDEREKTGPTENGLSAAAKSIIEEIMELVENHTDEHPADLKEHNPKIEYRQVFSQLREKNKTVLTALRLPEKANLTNANLDGFKLNELNAQGADLRGSTLKNTDIGCAGMFQTNLNDLNLRNTTLFYANFDGASLQNVNFSGNQSLEMTYFGRANLQKANFNETKLVSVAFTQANLEGATFNHAIFGDEVFLSNAILNQAEFKKAKCTGIDINFNGASLIEANLEGADCSNVGFENAKLKHAKFTGAILTGANFIFADLTNAKLTGANLTNANFMCTDLTNAKLKGAILTNANFNGANLSNVDMTEDELRARGAIL